MKKTNNIYIFALGATGEGISGGDRIFIEFTRRWSEKIKLEIYTSQSGKRMCEVSNLPKHVVIHPYKFGILEYLHKILLGIFLGLTLKIDDNSIVYSASEFWMDSLPALILKLRFPNIKWVASWYQTAPNPVLGFWGGRSRLRALAYWLVQLPIKPLVSRFADFILINNENEKRHFQEFEKKLIVVLGAVDIQKINKYKLPARNASHNDAGGKITNLPKIYDAVFQGRFHPQKGVVELIKIWRLVVDKMPKAKLIMIGDGPLMGSVKFEIRNLKLEENVKLLGYVFDGDEKYKLFAQSKIVVHPALYDSGGMASAEAMAFSLPCVGFDLPAYDSYYPQGMIKAPIGNLELFAKNVISLLDNPNLRDKIGREAVSMIYKNWSWDKRAQEVLNKIILK